MGQRGRGIYTQPALLNILLLALPNDRHIGWLDDRCREIEDPVLLRGFESSIMVPEPLLFSAPPLIRLTASRDSVSIVTLVIQLPVLQSQGFVLRGSFLHSLEPCKKDSQSVKEKVNFLKSHVWRIIAPLSPTPSPEIDCVVQYSGRHNDSSKHNQSRNKNSKDEEH